MNEQLNIAETLANEMKSPEILLQMGTKNHINVVAHPDNWNIQTLDLEKNLDNPFRKRGSITVAEVDSFIDYSKRYGSLAACNIYLDVNYEQSKIHATSIFNDHADGDGLPGWRDHRCKFVPRFSKEWNTWTGKSGESYAMGQFDFAHFLENNIGDIASPAGSNLPSGSDVLTFVSKLEETRKVKFGSAVNLQNGTVQFEFIEDGDNATKGKLEMFKRFAIGIRPFFNGSAYQIEAALRYRIDRNTGEIKFWYELQRPDRVLEDASQEVIEAIRTKTGFPVIFGTPDL
jgi:uncharacterized protein YfdQ (DUF2303 family)